MKRQITLTICDGCRRDNLHGEIEIVQSRARRLYLDGDDSTIDICAECIENEMYFCRLCECVHNDAHPCGKQVEALRELEAA